MTEQMTPLRRRIIAVMRSTTCREVSSISTHPVANGPDVARRWRCARRAEGPLWVALRLVIAVPPTAGIGVSPPSLRVSGKDRSPPT